MARILTVAMIYRHDVSLGLSRTLTVTALGILQQALWASIIYNYDLAHKHTTVSTILLFGCALILCGSRYIYCDIHYESVYQVDFSSPMCEFPYISYVLSVVYGVPNVA